MTEYETSTDESNELTEPTDASEDVEHHLGGTAAVLAGFEAFAPPEEPARLPVEAVEPGPTTDGYVGLKVHSDGVAGQLILDTDQARALADRLATAAADLGAARDE